MLMEEDQCRRGWKIRKPHLINKREGELELNQGRCISLVYKFPIDAVTNGGRLKCLTTTHTYNFTVWG